MVEARRIVQLLWRVNELVGERLFQGGDILQIRRSGCKNNLGLRTDVVEHGAHLDLSQSGI